MASSQGPQQQQLDQRIEELQLIRSSLVLADEFSWTGTADEIRAWEHSLDQNSWPSFPDSLPPYSFCVKLGPGAGASNSGGATAANKALWLQIDLPSDAVKEVQLDLLPGSGRDSHGRDRCALESSQLERFKSQMRARWKDSGEEDIDHRLFDLMTCMQEQINDEELRWSESAPDESRGSPSLLRQQLSSSDGAAAAGPSSSSSARAISDASTTLPPLKMSCVIFWSHHLIANSKRRDFAAWSTELRLWTLLKIGWPGYLCFEGQKEDVDEIVRRVKGLQWAAIQVKWEDDWEYTYKDSSDHGQQQQDGKNAGKRSTLENYRSDALLACPLSRGHAAATEAQQRRSRGQTVRGGCEEVEAMKEIVDRLKLVGLTDKDLVGALGLRTKSAS